MKKILVIDGNSLLFRGFYATLRGSVMESKEGVPTNAIYAFANMINKAIETTNPTHVFVAFDTDKKTFRKEKYDFYKAQRKKPPQELIMQFPIARELIKNMGLAIYEKQGFEADDLIASVIKKHESNLDEAIVFSSDKDLLQLVSDKTKVFLVKKGISNLEKIDEPYLKQVYKLTPTQVIDFKALSGDKSDNIPGVKGIGEKGALNLIEEFSSLENIYQNIEKIKGKTKEKLEDDKDNAFISKEIATIDKNAPIPFTLSDLEYKGVKSSLKDFYEKYDMNSLLRKIKKQEPIKEIKIYNNFKDIDKDKVAILPVFKHPNYHKENINSLYIYDGKKVFLATKKDLQNVDIKKILQSDKTKKIVYDKKEVSVLLKKENISIKGVSFDFKLATYLIDSNVKDDIEKIFAFYNLILPTSDNQNYYKLIVKNIYDLEKKAKETIIKEDLEYLYYEIEYPLIDIFMNMELEGFKVDKSILDDFKIKYKKKLEDLEKEIYNYSEKEFNISSFKQVGEVLFDELNLPKVNKRSTSFEVLEKLKDKHPIIKLLLKHRKYSKLLSTYIEGLSSFVNEDSKIHAIFKQTLTQTGRISSIEPNLQNITIKDEDSRLIRKAFIPSSEKGQILAIDYSQVELRILASLAEDEDMIQAFEKGEDIHTTIAAKVFEIEPKLVNEAMRKKAKAVVFGVVYGISDWGLSKQLDITPKESKTFISAFFKSYPKVKEYLDDQILKCKENGYVKTLLNRKRIVKEINSSSYMTREFGKRIAMNTPIQGSAADIIKKAMIEVSHYLKENNFKSKLILQVHDELIFDVHEDEIYKIENQIAKIMENSINLKVEMKTNSKKGKNWHDIK